MGKVVSVLAFYSDDPSSNLAEGFKFFSVKGRYRHSFLNTVRNSIGLLSIILRIVLVG